MFRNVPLRPVRQLHVDVGPRLRVDPVLVAPWTHALCAPLRLVAYPIDSGRPSR